MAPTSCRRVGDAVGRDAGDLLPEPRRLVVVWMHRREEPIGGQAVDLGQQLPGEGNRLALEVVADREIAEHLEEGQVRRVAHLVDISRAETLLHGGQARAGGVLAPRKKGIICCIPAVVSSTVGSSDGGISDELGMRW